MIQQSRDERARLVQALSKKLGWGRREEDDRIHVRRGDLRALLASQAVQPVEADGDKLAWHVPENLRWLAEQSDRPDYMPCGALTGVFLKQAADMMEAASRRTAVADTVSEGQRWQHVKRGTEYEVIGLAGLQIATGDLVDGSTLVVYRGDDGKLWAREEGEFTDGRFTLTSTQPAPIEEVY